MELTAVVASIRAAFSSALGFSPSARLRGDIYRNVELYKRLQDADLKQAADSIAALVTDEAEALAARGQAGLKRVRPWNTAIVAVLGTGLCAALGYWLLPPGGWLSWLGLAGVGGGLFFFVVGGLLAFFKDKDEEETEEGAVSSSSGAGLTGGSAPEVPHARRAERSAGRAQRGP